MKVPKVKPSIAVIPLPEIPPRLVKGVHRAPCSSKARRGHKLTPRFSNRAQRDSQDFLQAVKSASLLARVHHQQATAMSAREAWELGTIGGARALRMDDEIGSLEVGKRADVVVFDGTHPYSGLDVALAAHPAVRAVWSRRGMWKPGRNVDQLAKAA